MELKQYIELFEEIKWYGSFFSIKDGPHEMFFQNNIKNIEVTYEFTGGPITDDTFDSFYLSVMDVEKLVDLITYRRAYGDIYSADVMIHLGYASTNTIDFKFTSAYGKIKDGGVTFNLTQEEAYEFALKLKHWLEHDTIKDITI